MLQWLYPSPSSAARPNYASPFREEAVEIFQQAIECYVISDIGVLKKGRVTTNGCSWQAVLCNHACQVTLLPGQPVFAIGRRGLALIVVPYHCLI